MRRPIREALTLAGPAGGLEALVEKPASTPRGVAVVCHPHPLHGGTMQNKVVHTLARAFGELGLATVRFNFRGVGASEGGYADGEGELADALAVLDWAAGQEAGDALWLGGFSFGACVSLRAANLRAVRQLVAIAPPVDRCALDEPPRCPTLVIQGDGDELVDTDTVIDWVNSLPPGPELAVLEGADHFFHGRLRGLKRTVLDTLGPAAGELSPSRQ